MLTKTPHLIALVVISARAKDDQTPLTDYEVPFEGGDIMQIIRVHDDDWWLGLHLDESKRFAGRFLLRSHLLDRVPPPPTKDAPVLFHGWCPQPAICFGIFNDLPLSRLARAVRPAISTAPWDLQTDLGDVICITEVLPGLKCLGGLCEGSVNNRRHTQMQDHG